MLRFEYSQIYSLFEAQTLKFEYRAPSNSNLFEPLRYSIDRTINIEPSNLLEYRPFSNNLDIRSIDPSNIEPYRILNLFESSDIRSIEPSTIKPYNRILNLFEPSNIRSIKTSNDRIYFKYFKFEYSFNGVVTLLHERNPCHRTPISY